MTEHNFLKAYTFKSGVTVSNRIVMAPLTQTMGNQDETVSPAELAWYRLHSGDAGMIITGSSHVSALGKGFEGEFGAYDDRFIPSLRDAAAAIKSRGSKAILQIFDAGRISSTKILRGRSIVSASANRAPRDGYETPRALDAQEVLETIKNFGEATRRAIEAGWDGVEIHGANTYLIQQFFSPNSNQRDDEWGGNLENRMRFPLAVIAEVQSVIAAKADRPFIMGYRISPEEVEEPGITLEDTFALVEKLKALPLDYLSISLGYAWRTSLLNQADQETILSKFVKQVGDAMPLFIAGQIVTPADADRALADGATFAVMGLEMIREPNWVRKVIANDEQSIRYEFSLADAELLVFSHPSYASY
nr:NADH-dependent flavin oxidoreductase [Weissella oryzae]